MLEALAKERGKICPSLCHFRGLPRRGYKNPNRLGDIFIG